METIRVCAVRYTPPLLGDIGLVSAAWVQGDPLQETSRVLHRICLPVREGRLWRVPLDPPPVPPMVLEYLILALPDVSEEADDAHTAAD